MASIQFTLRSRLNKNVAIKIRFTDGRKLDIITNTGFTINPKDWSDSTNLPKNTIDSNKKLINELKKLESFVHDKFNTDMAKKVLIDKFWLENSIKECFNRIEKSDSDMLINHIQYIIDTAATRKIKGSNRIGLSSNRVKGYITFRNLLEEYEKVIKKKIHFADINKVFIEKLTKWLLNTKKYSVNYSGKQIDNIKTTCLDAETLGIFSNPYFRQIESFKENNEDRYIQTLSFDEIDKIRDTEMKLKSLINAKKWILLGCELGQRISDLFSIEKTNLRYNNSNGNVYIDITQQKTKKSVTIPVLEIALDIIENDMPYIVSTQKLNEHMKEVCKIAGINEVVEGKKPNSETKRKELGFYPKFELITTHSLRRSFATNYYKKIPTPILMNITGHSKESTFLEYINQREDKDANADLFLEKLKSIKNTNEPKLRLVKNG